MIIPFPSHRSHGATAGVAKAIAKLETAKRTGRLNSIRAQTRKRLEPLLGFDQADKAADDLVRNIRIQLSYRELSNSPSPKQKKAEGLILSLTGNQREIYPHGDGVGEASAQGQGTKFLAGMGGAHDLSEYDAAHAREEGAA